MRWWTAAVRGVLYVVDGGDSLGGTRARARLASKGAAAAAEWDDRGEHDCINKVYYTVLYRLLA